ncbi:hypothetical protein KW797_02850, partial [Candidatus Parcubacteria bacterium]|nr:hypothetical protein [Candidatus Parcubacteria bacterium]
YAFYSADTGAECALYYDTKQNIFPTSTGSTLYQGAADCAGVSIMTSMDRTSRTSSAATSTFILNAPPNYCAEVLVAKFNGQTKIESEGFNTCNAADARRLERALRIYY